MTDFKNNPEITENIEHYLPNADIKISLVICCWGTSHLLKRSVETYCNQDFRAENFEIIANVFFAWVGNYCACYVMYA